MYFMTQRNEPVTITPEWTSQDLLDTK